MKCVCVEGGVGDDGVVFVMIVDEWGTTCEAS